VRCGAFDSVHENRAAVWQGLDATLERGAAAQRDREIGQGTLFGGPGGDSAVDAPPLPDVPPWTDRERLAFEKELLGFYVSGHPLGSVASELAQLTDATSAALEGKDGREVRVGGLLTGLRETRTRQGKRMGFGVLEDLEGSFELVIFSKGFSEHERLLREALAAGDAGGRPIPLIVMGTLEAGDAAKILVRDILKLSEAQERLTAELRVRVLEPDISRDTMVALRRVLTQHPGDCAVFVHIMIPGESETIVSVGGVRGVKASDELRRDVDALFGKPVAECSL
jgi:DNA polymerase-3 subunit alpha